MKQETADNILAFIQVVLELAFVVIVALFAVCAMSLPKR